MVVSVDVFTTLHYAGQGGVLLTHFTSTHALTALILYSKRQRCKCPLQKVLKNPAKVLFHPFSVHELVLMSTALVKSEKSYKTQVKSHALSGKDTENEGGPKSFSCKQLDLNSTDNSPVDYS